MLASLPFGAREVGESTNQLELHFSSPCSGFVSRLCRLRELSRHDGCVNTVAFSPDGHQLLSGSDDTKIIRWNWRTGDIDLEWDSGHVGNVFQARQVGYGKNTVVSCAADGQVRMHLLSNSGAVHSKRISKHHKRAHKLALDPQQIHCFYSCAEDAIVRHFDIRQKAAGRETLLEVHSSVSTRKERPVSLYGMNVNPMKPTEFVVCGDEEFVYTYDARMIREDRKSMRLGPIVRPLDQFCPSALASKARQPLYHCTSCSFSRRGELLVQYYEHDIFLFHPWLKGKGRSDSRHVPTDKDGWKRQRGVSDVSHGSPPKRTCGSGDADNWLPRRSGDSPSAAHRGAPSEHRADKAQSSPAKQSAPAVEGAEKTGEESGSQQAARTTEQDAAQPLEAAAAGTSQAVAREAEHEDGGEREGIADGAACPPVDEEMNAANDEAEELLRGLFDEMPALDPSSGSQARSQRGAADSRAGGDAQAARSSPDEAEPAYEEEEDSEEDPYWRSDDDDDYDEPDQLSFVHLLGARRMARANTKQDGPPKHSLSGYIPEEPTDTWLQPDGDRVVQRFRGRRNVETVKGISFYGLDDEYIASGSDCGHLFVWSKKDACLRAMLPGDNHILNCVEAHPSEPFVLATSGIDSDVKIWGLNDTGDSYGEECVKKLERTLRSNAQNDVSMHRNVFLPFFLGGNHGNLGFDV